MQEQPERHGEVQGPHCSQNGYPQDQRIELYRNMVFAQSENWQEQIQVFWNGSLGKWDLSFIHLRMAGMIRQFQ